jgi:hypothetical protein
MNQKSFDQIFFDEFDIQFYVNLANDSMMCKIA